MLSNEHLMEDSTDLLKYYKQLLSIINEFNKKTVINLDDINLFSSQRQKIYELIQLNPNGIDDIQAEIIQIIQQIQQEEAKTKIIIEKELSQTKHELIKLQNLKRSSPKYTKGQEQEARFIDKFK